MRAHPDAALKGDHNECPGCGELFNSTHAFEKHRTGEHAGGGRRCLHTDEMRARGMVQRPGGWWVSEARNPLTDQWPFD